MSDLENNPFAEADSASALDSEFEGIDFPSYSEQRDERVMPTLNSRQPNGNCCNIGAAINAGGERVKIMNAQKTNDSGGSSYITYAIKFNDQQVRRRYSEFETLRKSLTKLHPTVIVPPIPEKHSIADYATIQNKAKADVAIIEKRKRMLVTFLNRVAQHPKLSRDHIFHRFLEKDVPWSEVLHSPPLSTLPRNILQVSPANLPSQSPDTLSIPLLNPSSSQILKNPDPEFAKCEEFTASFSNHMNQNMEKTNRRILKRLSDLSHDYAELGATYNGFSLNESEVSPGPGNLSKAVEKVGQAIDKSFVKTRHLVAKLESNFSEPLQEYTQFAQIIKQVLRYRHMKHLQLELTEETLEKQKNSLEALKKSDDEVKRLEVALDNDPLSGSNLRGQDGSIDFGENLREDDQPNNDPFASQRHHYKRSSGSKLFSVLSHTIHGIMDVDPESTRRNSISKTTDYIFQLEDALKVSKNDLDFISVSIRDDLERFQQQKLCDLRNMLLSYAEEQVEWCKMNLSTWKAAKAEVEKITL